MNTKISKNRQKKEQIVAQLSEKIKKAKSIIFTNYQGLTHKQLEGLKKALRELNAELVVTKNTLLKIALEKSTAFGLQTTAVDGSQNAESMLFNPTAALFVYDDITAPLKQLSKTLKSLGLTTSPASFAESRRAGGPTIKFGIVDNQALTGNELLRIAMLPSREVLLAQVVSGLNSPIYGLHRTLSWNLQKLVMTLSTLQQKKS